MPLLPGFLLVSAFVAGMHLANDSMAGERERGSLEPLMMNPISTEDLVVGKWLAISTLNLLGVALTLVCMVIVLQLGPLHIPPHLGDTTLAWMFITAVPLAHLAAALELLISTFARTMKEGHAHLSLLMLIPMMLGILGEFFPIDLKGWLTFIPVLSQQRIVSGLVRGQATSTDAAIVSGGGTLLFTLLSVWLTSKLLRNEKIVFGR